MGDANLEEFDLVLAGEDDLRPMLETERAGMLTAAPEDMRTVFASLLGDADRAVLTDAFAVWAAASSSAGLVESIDGWVDDDLAFARPWGFEPADVARPVLIVHGADDRFVPVAHGHWLAARIPGAEAWITETDGHLTLIERRVAEVHAWLLEHF
jgi:pimeloyl-ACP methyl ester carboxylesterase